MRVVGVIPVRLDSKRLPRKPLLAETGKSLIQHTWESASKARSLNEIIVAVDCDELAREARSFGARYEITRQHPSGTDRVAEVIGRCCEEAELIVNIQGDEPEIDPAHIDQVVNALAFHEEWSMATLVTPIADSAVLDSPHVVKAVCARNGRVLYFSRSLIPFVRDRSISEMLEDGNSPWKQHIGLYAYRKEYLLDLTKLPQSNLEQLENLEQLRALEQGAIIGAVEVLESSPGIDTPEEYAEFVARFRKSSHTAHATMTTGIDPLR